MWALSRCVAASCFWKPASDKLINMFLFFFCNGDFSVISVTVDHGRSEDVFVGWRDKKT